MSAEQSLEPEMHRMRFRKWIYRGIAICLGLLAVEVSLDVARLVSPRIDFQLSPPWSRVTLPDEVLGHRMSPYYPGNDARGFRNSSVLDKCDILAIGDSNTYGFATTPQYAWPRQLERHSGRSVYNMSCGAYGVCQYEVLLDRGLKLQPSLIVVGLVINNDFSGTYTVVYNRKLHCPANRFRISDPAQLKVFSELDKSAPFGDRPVGEGAPALSHAGVRSWLSSKSSLYGVARSLRSLLVGGAYYSPLRDDDPPQDRFEIAWQRPGRWAYAEQPALRTVFLDPNVARRRVDISDSRVQEGKRIAEAILLSMRDKAERAGAHFLIVLIPTKTTVYRELLNQLPDDQPESVLRYLDSTQSLTDSVEEFLRAERIDFVNSTSELRRCLDEGRRPYPESDDGHPNRDGYSAIADTVQRAIDELPISWRKT